jgi:hypothetical protein
MREAQNREIVLRQSSMNYREEQDEGSASNTWL